MEKTILLKYLKIELDGLENNYVYWIIKIIM